MVVSSKVTSNSPLKKGLVWLEDGFVAVVVS